MTTMTPVRNLIEDHASVLHRSSIGIESFYQNENSVDDLKILEES